MSGRALHHYCNLATEILVYAMVVFSPWAFGTTQSWSIWTMNAAGYTLGVLLAVKWVVVRAVVPAHSSPWHWLRGPKGPRSLKGGMALLTVFILGYCLVAALNARAVYDHAQIVFRYHDQFIDWLPHSYDQERSFQIFWNYLALACAFWAVHDWLVTGPPSESGRRPPPRLRRLLWVLAINGTLLAFQGLMQRADGGAKLLWFMETRINRQAGAQFGPYAYRANAAQYFNLLWPVLLGFWWWLDSASRGRRDRSGGSDPGEPDRDRTPQRRRNVDRILLPLILLMAVCPIISLSRAGAIVTGVSVAAVGGVLLMSARGPRRRMLGIIAAVTVVLGALTMYFNGGALLKRFATASQDLYEGREKTYVIARKILADYPVFGVGPGAFEHVFQLYRDSTEEYWPAQLHHDWLETALTFGYVGFIPILAALLLCAARWFVPGGLSAPWTFAAMLWISLGGCLLHARVDFPFQIYSILFLALVMCAVAFSVTKQ